VPHDWTDISEVVAGKLFRGQVSPNAINPESLIEPYGKIVPLLKKGESTEKIIEVIGPESYRVALEAADRSKSIPANWPLMLDKAAALHDAGTLMDKLSKKFLAGENVDPSLLIRALARVDENTRQGVTLDKVKPDKDPFIPVGWGPLDLHVGGIPKHGLTVIGGAPGTGKTYTLVKLAVAFAKKHPKKKLILFTMEMTMGQLAARLLDEANIPLAIRKNITLYEDSMSPTDVVAIAARMDDVGLVCIDFAEMMIQDEVSESSVAAAYRTLANAAKNLRCPFVLLSQLSRGYVNRIPMLTDLRYSGAAEAMGALVMLLFNPSQIVVGADENKTLPYRPGRAWIIIAKSRFGHKHKGPGAMEVEWREEEGGWGDNSGWKNWVSLSGVI